MVPWTAFSRLCQHWKNIVLTFSPYPVNPSHIPVLLASFPTEKEISVIMPSVCLSASMFWTCFLSNWQRDLDSKRIKCLRNPWKSACGLKSETQMNALAKGKVGRMQLFTRCLLMSVITCTALDSTEQMVLLAQWDRGLMVGIASCMGERKRGKGNRTHL